MKKIIILLMCLTMTFNALKSILPDIGHIYVTSADEKHYYLLLGLIGSIHEVDFKCLNHIVVFDLGFTPSQRSHIESMDKVTVYDLELTHPDLLTQFVTDYNNRTIRGWFAWKPVALKQALDIFPYCLYVDAGTLILQSPQNLFEHIRTQGCFFTNVEHNLTDRLTNPVKKMIAATFSSEQQALLLSPETLSIDGGFQGVSRLIYDTYVLPMYENAKDLSLFADDHSAPLGFGAARHDQTLFSLYAHALSSKPTLYNHGLITLNTHDHTEPLFIHWEKERIIKNLNHVTIFRSRRDPEAFGNKQVHIKYKQ